jgi:energy-coupling factor transport system permease protein
MINNNTKLAKLPIDPRCAILLLFMVNIIAFTQQSIYIEIATFITLVLLMIYCGCGKQAIKWILIFGFLLVLQYCIFPIAPKFITTSFFIITVYARKIFPCLMIGTIIRHKIHMQYLIIALRKWRFPQKLIIPLSVTFRYFPAIKEESMYIKDAMRLRKISGFKKIECFVVPLIISATNTADELTAAAVTRGIDNPIKKTSAIDIRFSFMDYIILFIGILFIIITIII